jgi:amidase
MPLAPTLDSVGLFARDLGVLARAAAVLLPHDDDVAAPALPSKIHVVREAFEWADAEVRDALIASLESLRQLFGDRVRETSLQELCGDERAADPATWLTIYRVLQGTEMMSCHGPWLELHQPTFGPAPSAGLTFVKKLDRTRVAESIQLRERLARRMNATLAAADLLCLPSAPTVAPLRDSKAYDRSSDYYQRTLSLTTIAGAARLPQISLPLGNVGGAPVGLSLAAAHGADRFLIRMAGKFVADAGSPSS